MRNGRADVASWSGGDGGARGIRTPDLLRAREALSLFGRRDLNLNSWRTRLSWCPSTRPAAGPPTWGPSGERGHHTDAGGAGLRHVRGPDGPVRRRGPRAAAGRGP